MATPVQPDNHSGPTRSVRAPNSPPPVVQLGQRQIGPGNPVYVIAEIGINHNGELEIAKALIEAAAAAGANAVKFQKRTPEVSVPKDQWAQSRDTPWGPMTYIDYRTRMELSQDAYASIAAHCQDLGVDWFFSCWDEPAVAFAERFEPLCFKAPSATLTDLALLRRMKRSGQPLILSTGMSTQEEVDAAVAAVGTEHLLIAHTNSTHPCPPDGLNLRTILTLQQRFAACPIGYSGHEAGIAASLAAATLGATFIERHLTLDKTMWGTDQAASLEPHELQELIAGLRTLDVALGDGVKRLYASELPALRKLRRVTSSTQSAGPEQ